VGGRNARPRQVLKTWHIGHACQGGPPRIFPAQGCYVGLALTHGGACIMVE
jgi:hypothetical protein